MGHSYRGCKPVLGSFQNLKQLDIFMHLKFAHWRKTARTITLQMKLSYLLCFQDVKSPFLKKRAQPARWRGVWNFQPWNTCGSWLRTRLASWCWIGSRLSTCLKLSLIRFQDSIWRSTYKPSLQVIWLTLFITSWLKMPQKSKAILTTIFCPSILQWPQS